MVYDDKKGPYVFVLIVIGLVLCGGLYLFWLASADAEAQKATGVCSGVLALVGVGTLVSWLRWRRVNRRRQAAAINVHGGAALADIQPFPEETALALPAVIVHKNSRLRMMGWLTAGYIIGLMLFNMLDRLLFGTESLYSFSDSHTWFFFAAYVIGFMAGSSVYSPYTQLEFSDDGLFLSIPTKPARKLRWEEARLFAVRGPAFPFGRAVTYELAGAKGVITWKPLCRLHWWSILRPIVPFDVYEQQTAALLSMIAARTHLPLYDVSRSVEEPASGSPALPA